MEHSLVNSGSGSKPLGGDNSDGGHGTDDGAEWDRSVKDTLQSTLKGGEINTDEI